jgi:glycosyltransferase involved in cell wall biosynthesis
MSRRLLSIIQTPTFGGPHNQMLRLTEPLNKLGWETRVILPAERESGFERLSEAGIEVVEIPIFRMRKKLDPRVHGQFVIGFRPTVRQLRSQIREYQPDVVQVCGLMSLHGAIAAYLERVPVVWQLLSTFAPLPLRFLLTPLVCKIADVVMTTGTEIGRQHPGLAKAEDRIIPFFPPVDTGLFKPDRFQRAKARQELNIPEGALLIGTIGNQNWQKGHDYFVDIARRVYERHPYVRFRILGAHTPSNADYYQKNVIQRARDYGLLEEGVLDFVEPGSRVAELLPALDIFLLTSRAEGVPTAILEAMSCGIPVVATDVGSVKEVVEEDITGLVVPPADVSAAIEALEGMLRDANLMSRMGWMARQRAIERFDVNVCASVHATAYQQAMERRF